MSEDTNTAREEINAGFDPLERRIRREGLWVPLFTSVAWTGSLGLVIWSGFTGEGWDVLSHAIILVFAIMMVWFYWDTESRRRIAAMKYDTAVGLLDHLAKEYGWTWEKTDEAGSVSLHAPESEEDDEPADTEK